MDFLDQSNRLSANRVRSKEFRLRQFSGFIALLLCSAILVLVGQPSVLLAHSGQADKEASQADDPKPNIKRLIMRLGDADHLVRSESEEQLLEIGEPAISPLQAVLNFEDPEVVPDNEVRLRGKRLLILIQRSVRERKLAEFLDGTRDDIDLEGWPEFQEITGSQPQARRLFIKLHQARSSLIESPAKGKLEAENQLHKTIVSWVRLSSNGNAESVINNLGAVLFAATRKTKWEADKPAAVPKILISDTKRIQRVLVSPQMITTLQSHVAGAEIKALISNWLDSLQLTADPTKHIATTISVIESYQLTDKSELPLQFALDSKLSAHVRSSALAVLSATGSAELTPKLKPLLSDSSVVGNYLLTRQLNKDKPLETEDSQQSSTNPLLEVQVRDLALATSILWQGNSPEEFGFHAQAVDENKLVINQAGFFTEKERSDAFSKWQEHLAAETKN